MAAPSLDVNWEAVRTLALQVGVREAARQCGIGESTVQQRSAREGWIKALPRSEPLPPTMQPKIVTNVTKPHDVLSKYGENTRLNHAKAALKISEKVAEIAENDPNEALTRIPEILGAGKHAALIHGFAGTGVQIGLRLDEIAKSAAISVNLPEIGEIGT